MQKQERAFFISTINLSNIVWLHENRKLTQNINKQILKPPSDDIYICGNKWSMAFVSATSISNILRLKKCIFIIILFHYQFLWFVKQSLQLLAKIFRCWSSVMHHPPLTGGRMIQWTCRQRMSPLSQGADSSNCFLRHFPCHT